MRACRVWRTSLGRTEELRKLEEALPRLKEWELEKVSEIVQSTNRSGMVMASIPKLFLWTLQKKREEKNCGILRKRWSRVADGRNKPARRCFFLIPKNVTSERPIAPMPTLIRWWKALRAPEVAQSQQKYRVDWDVTSWRNGGAQRYSMGSIDGHGDLMERAKAEDRGAVALVSDLSKAFERVSLLVVWAWAWATHFCFPKKILRVLCGYFEHQRCVQFEGCAAEPLTTITAILPGSKWSCLLLRNVLQDALSEVTKMYPSLKLRIFLWMTIRPW